MAYKKQQENRGTVLSNCFMTNTAKEIRTHLQVIKSLNEILQDTLHGIPGNLPTKYLKRMTIEIDKVTKVTNDFGDTFDLLNEVFELEYEVIDFDYVIKLAVLSVKDSILNKIIISGKTEKKVKVDANKIIKVIKCLLTNAAQYSKQTDYIHVTLTTSSVEDHVVICIQDHGIGIAKNKQKNIFEKKDYNKKVQDDRYPGLGVGLYLSKEIVERHDGHIWLDSSLKNGSKFYFSIPIIK